MKGFRIYSQINKCVAAIACYMGSIFSATPHRLVSIFKRTLLVPTRIHFKLEHFENAVSFGGQRRLIRLSGCANWFESRWAHIWDSLYFGHLIPVTNTICILFIFRHNLFTDSHKGQFMWFPVCLFAYQSPSEITKTLLYHFDPLKPHFYRVTRVYIIFLISAQKHRLMVLIRTASPRRF